MVGIKKWIDDHPTLWEFIKFNVLSNVATMANFVVMWVCIGFVFKSFSGQPFQFFIFNYTTSESLMLCGFLSFLAATACAQTVNFFVQKNLVFKSSADFGKAVPKFIILAVVLVILSAALPAYSQTLFINIGVPAGVAPALANIVNILCRLLSATQP